MGSESAPAPSAQSFADIAQKKGYCTAEQIARARKQQQTAGSKGDKALAQQLVEMGILTQEQARACERLVKGGTVIAGFEILEKVGQGGMGAVFRARQVSMDRDIALKILPPTLAQDPLFKRRFLNEARVCARLSHLNIINGIDCGESGGYIFFAMEFVEGRTIREVMRENGKFDPPAALQIVRQMVEALSYAKRQGLVHRDVKPDNIMLTPNGVAKLCDLGLAKKFEGNDDSSLTQAGTAVGTPHYIAPEQARGENVDFNSDIYSLGATFYHMLTGKTPFNAPTSAAIMALHISEEIKSPCEITPGIPIGYGQVISKMMAKAQADRYPSPDDLLADLDALQHGRAPSAAMFKAKSSCQMPPLAAAKGVVRLRTTGPQTAVSDRMQREPRTRGAEKSGQSLIWAAVGGVALLVIVAALATSGNGKPAAVSNAPLKQPDAIPNAPPVPSPAPKPKEEPKAGAGDARLAGASPEELQRLFDAAEDLRKKKPDDFAGAAAEFEKVRAAARGTEFERKAEAELAAIGNQREAAVAAAAQRFTDAANALAAQGKFDSAIAVWENLPADQADLLKPRAAEALAALGIQVETRFKPLVEEAVKCLAEKRWADGRKAMEAVDRLEFRAAGPHLKELRDRLAAGEQTDADAAHKVAISAAEPVFMRYMTTFEAATLKGDIKAARKIAADAAADSALKELAARTQGLAEVCTGLEKVEAGRTAALEQFKDGREHSFETVRGTLNGTVLKVSAEEIILELKLGSQAGLTSFRISDLKQADHKRPACDFTPQTAAEHLALAIRTLADDDNAAAGTELAAAKDHALTPYYQARLDERLLIAAEAAARSAWEALERDAGFGKLPEAKAREVTERLAAFEKEYGKSKFAASVQDKLAALKERLGQAQELTLDLGGGVKLDLVLIHPGKFMMGSPPAEPKRTDSETQHPVTLTQPYYIGKYLVTQEQYESVMGKNPSSIKGEKNPVDLVSWIDTQDFCARLSKKLNKNVKLPTEAQWEYACRAGSTTAYYFGDAEKDLGEYCWYHDNSDGKPPPPDAPKVVQPEKITHPVGGKKPNAWGLYDMHGDVCEWCQDWFDVLTDQPAVDPTGPAQGQRRVLRGGSTKLSAGDCRSAFRHSYTPDRFSGHVGGIGLRIVVLKN